MAETSTVIEKSTTAEKPPVAKKAPPKTQFVHYDPSKEFPARKARLIINEVVFEPYAFTELSQPVITQLQNSNYFQELVEAGAITFTEKPNGLSATSLAGMSIKKARGQIFACADAQMLRKWQRSEKRQELRVYITNRLAELREQDLDIDS